MLPQLKSIGFATAVCLAACLSSAQAQPASPRMNPRAVAVTSDAPVTTVEAVRFAGQAVINSRMAPDPDFGQPSLIMLFDLSGVVGTGAQSGTRYIIPAQEYVVRPHVANQVVEFVFPMTPDVNQPVTAARTGLARFVLNVDLATGDVTSNAAVFSAR